MDKLKEGVEQVIRNVYGLHPQMVVSGIEVQFRISTSLENGILAADPKDIIPPVTERRPYVKRKKVRKGVSRSLHREYTTSKEDIFCIRAFFSKWKKEKLFTESELIFFEQTEGVFFKRLSQETKQKMREVFEEVRTRVLFAKKNRLEPANV